MDSKTFSNFATALLSGMPFLKSENTVLEMQSRTFAVVMVSIISPAIISSVEPKFLQFRSLYETRERNSKIYSAPAWLTAMILVEIPYAILGTVFYFLPWYYMIGMPNDSATAGYEFLLLMLFQLWTPHCGMWIAAMCSDMTTNGFT